jgi:hypothetical protein
LFEGQIDKLRNKEITFDVPEIPNPFETVSAQLDKLRGETKEYKHELGSVKEAFMNAFEEFTGIDLGAFKMPSMEDVQAVPTPDNTESKAVVKEVEEVVKKAMISMAEITAFTKDVVDTFTNSFGSGMANVVVQGEKVMDVLKNIGKLLLSSAIQKGLSLLLGGVGGGGIFGKLFGGIFGDGKATSVNDALITSSGSVVKFHPDDNILAMKDFSKLQTGGAMKVQVEGIVRGENIYISGTRGQERFNR